MQRPVSVVAVLGIVAACVAQVGRVDTIGGTTYDISVICGGMQRMVFYSPGQGVHVGWCWSATGWVSSRSTGTTTGDGSRSDRN